MQRKYMKNYILLRQLWRLVCAAESLQIIRYRDSMRTTDGAVIGTAYYYYLLSPCNALQHIK